MLVDDQEMIRAGLRVILEAHPDLEVACEAGDGLTALDLLAATPVDVVLLDLNMPGIDGVETTRRIRATHGSSPRILVLTTFDQDENVVKALRAGADGFFGKGAGPAELSAGILRVAQGENALSAAAIGALVGHLNDAPEAPEIDPAAAELFTQLTPRELEVVRLIVDGLDNAEIGRRIFISPFTVKTHANRAMMKVAARDRAHLVSLAVQAGIRP
ncbi:MAG: response regulator transcription factor [Microbacterium sp.]